jgi:Domain of unknown function (DUF4831)
MVALIQTVVSFLGVLFVLSGCAAVSQPVYKVPEGNDCTKAGVIEGNCQKFDGVPYVLPQTALKITIPITATTDEEGRFVTEARDIYAGEHKCDWKEGKGQCDEQTFKFEFNDSAKCIGHVYKYADELGVKIALNEPNGNTKIIYPKTSYKMGDVSVVSDAEPDPDQLYYVEVKGGMFEHRSLDISFAPSGIMNEITSNAENKSAEFSAKTFGSILGAAVKISSFGGVGIKQDKKFDGVSFDDCDGNAATGIPMSKYRSLVYRALATLRYIDDFSLLRNEQFKGTANTATPKDNLELRLKELDASNSAALEMFEANKKSETKSYEVTILPNLNTKQIQLATFSKACGLYRTVEPSNVMHTSTVPQSDKDGCLVSDTPNVQAVLSTPPQISGDSLPKRIVNSLNIGTNTRGIYYRIPETTRLTIKKDGKDLLVKDISIAQLGKVVSLPAETGSSNVTYKVTLDPITGMLLKVSITSEAVSADSAKNFIDPVGDYLKARKDSKDVLTQLQREESLLKVKKSIKELKDAIGQ